MQFCLVHVLKLRCVVRHLLPLRVHDVSAQRFRSLKDCYDSVNVITVSDRRVIDTSGNQKRLFVAQTLSVLTCSLSVHLRPCTVFCMKETCSAQASDRHGHSELVHRIEALLAACTRSGRAQNAPCSVA
eukprot:15209-Heterococcus_DN1.PRE.2